MGVVYLIHFERACLYARHYLGYADDLEARIKARRLKNWHSGCDLCPICHPHTPSS